MARGSRTSLRLARLATAIALACVLLQYSALVMAADPDPLQDYCIADLTRGATTNGFPCKPAANATSDDFWFPNLAVQADPTRGGRNPFNGTATFGLVQEWPALNTLGLGLVRLDIAPGGVIQPHTHNLATEILFVLEGEVYTGFVSNQQQLFAKVVKKGEAFIFPRGLLHFQMNTGTEHCATLNVLNSQNPGIQLMPLALLGSGIPTELLSRSLLIQPPQVEALAAIFSKFPAPH